MPDRSHGFTPYVTPPAYGSARTNVADTERIASVIGGSALAALGAGKRSAFGWLLTGLGGLLLWRGVSGRCPGYAAAGVSTARTLPEPVEVTRAVTVNRPRPEVYAFWHRFERLPEFMHHLRRVSRLSDHLWHWEAKGHGPLPDIAWDAEVVEDQPNEVIAWRSLPGADVDNAGHVRFTDAPDGGTEVHVRIAYRPPAGAVGHAVAGWLGPVLGQLVKEDVRRFKHIMEAGEVPTIEGQPKGD